MFEEEIYETDVLGDEEADEPADADALQDIINDWKEQYGNVYHMELGDFEFYFKLITYAQYQTLLQLSDNQEELDEAICKFCILDPIVEDWHGDIFAGYVTSIAKAIKEESLIEPNSEGTNDVKTLVATGVDAVSGNFLRQIPLVIVRAFPSYKLHEIKEMNLRDQLDMYTEAVWLIREFDDINLEFQDD